MQLGSPIQALPGIRTRIECAQAAAHKPVFLHILTGCDNRIANGQCQNISQLGGRVEAGQRITIWNMCAGPFCIIGKQVEDKVHE